MSRLAELDRRWLFLAMGVVVVLPFLFPLPLGGAPSEESRAFYARIEAAAVSGRPILFSLDYSPETAPEVGPIATAALQHCAARGASVVLFTPVQDNYGISERLAERALEEGFEYGEDLVFLGFKPEIRPLILGLAENLRVHFPQDARGTPVDELPLTAGIRDLDDFALVISITADDLSEDWVKFGNGRYGASLAFGISSNFYGSMKPYVEAGQVDAILRGMKGASEYESLLQEEGVTEGPGDGTRGMGSQATAHVLLLALIVLGNLSGRRRRAGR